MTSDITDPLDEGPEAAVLRARERVRRISFLFEEISVFIDAWKAQVEQVDKASAQKTLAKMGELQTAHLMLLRAEEAFFDKFSQESAEAGPDHDLIRDEIGRRLDRIRDANAAD